MEIRHARPSTKHRISRQRSRSVVETTSVVFRENAPRGDSRLQDQRIVFLGVDRQGELLEVMAIETNSGLLVIHAQKIRNRYLALLEGGL